MILLIWYSSKVRNLLRKCFRSTVLSNIIIYASEFHEKFNVKRFFPGIQKQLQAESAAHVIKCVFEIRHFKQRIPGLVGVTCG